MRAAWALLLLAIAAPSQVRVWEAKLALPAYEEGLPDPNPPFDEFSTTKFNYPYTLRETLGELRTPHNWRAIYLENEYLKCSVLPDVGGHLYTCTDKISGQPMFYANPSIKKALIGYRGAWAAFGIEFNFPVSHNWVSMSPVDFAYATHPDGSASVSVGNIDRAYGMEWIVELILRPGSTVLEQRVTLNNRSDFRHRFYWWSNAGVQAWDDSRIQYPMRFAAAHGFAEIQPWPVDADGVDLSVIRNQTKGPVSLFVHGSREPFMGIWHPKTRTGVAHYANYAELPAKKIWSWGVDSDGLDWRKALSDNESAYVEIQGGLFRNQETYAFLEPRETIHFSEYWMPVRELGGIVRASLTGVLNFSRDGNRLTASFNANRRITGASVRILAGDQPMFSAKIDLSPEKTWTQQVTLQDVSRKYTFELRDAAGTLLLRQTEGEYDFTPESEIQLGVQRPLRIPADEFQSLGRDQELNGKLLLALESYREGLRQSPDRFELVKSAGRLSAALLRYDEAVALLEPIARRDTTDGEIAYHLGVAYDGLGNHAEARIAFERAALLPAWHAAASLRLGELRARDRDLAGAGQDLENALRAAPADLRTAEELVAIRHALGKASPLAREWLNRFPTSYFLREELGEPDLAHLSADPERVLNIATEYIRLGLYEKAMQVLSRAYPAVPADQSEPGSRPPGDHPLVLYFRGYVAGKMGQPDAMHYAAASRSNTAFVFPSGAGTLDVLHAAILSNPGDATAHFLLGTHLFSRGLVDAGLAEWQKARSLNPKIPVMHASIGLALLRVKKDVPRALQAFQEGIAADPMNTALYTGIDQALSLLGRRAGERVAALERYPNQAQMPSALVFELALNRAEAEDFDSAGATFRNRFFAREEGGTNVRQVWVEVRLQQARSLARGGKCDAALALANQLDEPVVDLDFTTDGLQASVASARTGYLIGQMQLGCGQKEKAFENFRDAAKAGGASNAVWAQAAAKQLSGFDEAAWRKRLETALITATANSETSAFTGWWIYNVALLEQALGKKEDAARHFEEAILLPDRLLAHHLSRLAQATPE